MLEKHEEPAHQVVVDPRRESYRGVYSEQLAKEIDAAAADVPLLAPPTSNLLLQWRGIAYYVEFPSSLVAHMSAFAGSFIAQQAPQSNILKLADVVLAQCATVLPELTDDPSLARRLHAAVVDLAARLPGETSSATPLSSADEWWDAYIEEKPFRITLWSSQRVGYMAVFNAYETFITQCVQQLSGISGLRSGTKRFKAYLKRHLGDVLSQKCWHVAHIHAMRQVRHSLSHAGGRVTENLRNASHGVHVHDDFLQIMPEDIRRAYETLGRAALALITAVRDRPDPTDASTD